MPGIDGLELIRIVKKEYPNVCAIAMTGYSKEYKYVETINAGCHGFCQQTLSGSKRSKPNSNGASSREIFGEELNRLSITDALTGLYNQRHFYDRLNEETARAQRQNHELALILLDLDDFKQYNDNWAIWPETNCCKRWASVINSKMRQSVDSGYRYGGDEFAVMLIEAGEDVAEMMSDRIKAGILAECIFQPAAGSPSATRD
jgi:two-component system cell cycle response regulator